MDVTATDHATEAVSTPRPSRRDAEAIPEHDAVPVPDHGDGAALEEPSDPQVGRYATLGGIVGLVATAVVVAIGGALAGMSVASAVGLGIFVGLFSGIGFGFMMGATVPFARHLDAMSAHGRGTTAHDSGAR